MYMHIIFSKKMNAYSLSRQHQGQPYLGKQQRFPRKKHSSNGLSPEIGQIRGVCRGHSVTMNT